MSGLRVDYGKVFAERLPHFPKEDKLKIANFIVHIKKFGFDGLQGRNKSSDNVPFNHPNWSERVKYAQKNNLWHYHIGIPHYELSEKGDYTSEYVLHYILGDDFIKIVDMSPHPPLRLPDELD